MAPSISLRQRVALALRILFTKPQPIPAEMIDGHLPKRNIKELEVKLTCDASQVIDALGRARDAVADKPKDMTAHTIELMNRPPKKDEEHKRFCHARGDIPAFNPQPGAKQWKDEISEIVFDVGQPVWLGFNVEEMHTIVDFEPGVSLAYVERNGHKTSVYAPRLVEFCRIPLPPIPLDALNWKAEQGESLVEKINEYVRVNGFRAIAEKQFQNYKSKIAETKVQSEKRNTKANGQEKPGDVTST